MAEITGMLSLISFGAMVIMFLTILLISHRIGTTNHLLKKILKHLEQDPVEGTHDVLIVCDWCKGSFSKADSANYKGAVICRSCWGKQQRGG